MKMTKSIFSLLFLLLSGLGVYSYRQHDYLIDGSFLQGNALDLSNEVSEVFLSELEAFNNKVLERLADRMVTFLEKEGVDMDSKENVDALYNFLQKADVEVEPTEEKPISFKRKLLNGLKKAASGIGKEALMHTTRALVAYGIKEALPELERVFKHALGGVPLKLRIAIAPLVFKVWKGLFKKAKITPPPEFSLKDIMFDGLTPEQKEMALKSLPEKYRNGKL